MLIRPVSKQNCILTLGSVRLGSAYDKSTLILSILQLVLTIIATGITLSYILHAPPHKLTGSVYLCIRNQDVCLFASFLT